MTKRTYPSRDCTRCSRRFQASSRHALCPACRSDDLRRPCPGCGTLMRKTSRLCAECVPRTGVSNGHWRGGETRHGNGYVLRRVEASYLGRPKSGYVLEHVLVMEDKLGRRLYQGENVHHLNGVKDDNRPENLELWTRPQPSGIRVEDAVSHALDLIGKYRPDLLA